jgi:hypothetical protein
VGKLYWYVAILEIGHRITVEAKLPENVSTIDDLPLKVDECVRPIYMDYVEGLRLL